MPHYNNRRPAVRKDKGCRYFPATSIVVADFEFKRDRARHGAYVDANGSSACKSLRWPFKQIVCGSWLTLQFTPGAEQPRISHFESRFRPDYDEMAIAEHFFAELDNHPHAVLITWGGECSDVPVLRRIAHQHGLILPYQLQRSRPRRADRIDLCNEIEYSSRVHLSEYAAAQDIPAKPVPGKEVNRLVEQRDWAAVEEQCTADVLTTAIIAVRHFAAIEMIGQTGAACTEAILDRFCARPETGFIAKLRKWREALKD